MPKKFYVIDPRDQCHKNCEFGMHGKWSDYVVCFLIITYYHRLGEISCLTIESVNYKSVMFYDIGPDFVIRKVTCFHNTSFSS